MGSEEQLRRRASVRAALRAACRPRGNPRPFAGLARPSPDSGRENMEEAARHSLRWRCSVRTAAHAAAIRLSPPDPPWLFPSWTCSGRPEAAGDGSGRAQPVQPLLRVPKARSCNQNWLLCNQDAARCNQNSDPWLQDFLSVFPCKPALSSSFTTLVTNVTSFFYARVHAHTHTRT